MCNTNLGYDYSLFYHFEKTVYTSQFDYHRKLMKCLPIHALIHANIQYFI